MPQRVWEPQKILGEPCRVLRGFVGLSSRGGKSNPLHRAFTPQEENQWLTSKRRGGREVSYAAAIAGGSLASSGQKSLSYRSRHLLVRLPASMERYSS